ncbi:efflux RND transporter permease subunit [bacterium]|nr:efflux RND transporter permease subunit [bacterium]
MKISELSVKKPITVAMVFLLVLILGAIAFFSLPLDIMPDIEIPSLTVITAYPGANPIDVEKKVTEPLEKSLSIISGVKDVTSNSVEGMSVIMISFNWGLNLDEASNDIRAQLDMANFYLPEDAEKPTLFKFDFSQAPIVFYGVKIDPNLKFPEKYIQKNVIDRIMKVDGVGLVRFQGLEDEIVAIELSQKKMEKANISFGMIQQALSGYNLSVPAGYIDIARRYVTIRTDGELNSLIDLGNIPIIRKDSQTVYLKDLATVEFSSSRDMRPKLKVNRERGGMLFIQKAAGKNTIKVADATMAFVDEIQSELKQVELTMFLSLAQMIKDNLYALGRTLFIATILVILVVLLLLMNFRAAIVIAAALPFSLIISFIFMKIFGYTINMISLGALVIAIGMVVDAAIVIFENIFRHHYALNEPLKESAMYAPGEVGMAVTASVLTTVAIFFPLSFVTGFVGIFFSQLGMIVTIILIASLLTALTLIPAMSSLILKKSRKQSRMQTAVSNFWIKITSWTGKKIKASLSHGGWWILGFFLLFFASLALINQVPKEFIPDEDMGRIEINMELPALVNLAETIEVAEALQNLVYENIEDEKTVFYQAGAGGNMMFETISPNKLQVVIKLQPVDGYMRPSIEIADKLRKLIPKHIRGYKNFNISTASGFSMVLGMGGSGASLEIYGDDLDLMAKNAAAWKEKLLQVEGVGNVDISYSKGKREMRIKPDYVKAAEFGLSPAYIGMHLRAVFYGTKMGEFRQEGDVFNIILRYNREEFQNTQDLRSLIISTPTGEKLRLEQIATIIEVESPVSIDRKNRQRLITVTSYLKESRYLGDVTEWISSNMSEMKVPGITFKLGGSSKEMKDSFKSMMQILMLALVLVFMVMAAQFESFKEPFIVMFSVPFAVTGVFIALYITNQTLSMNAMIGLIMLVGIVVNNAIVLVDYTNTLRKRGMNVKDAIEGSVKERMKPIVMTALTTMCGMLPLAIATGAGAETWRPLGIAVIGGLLVSTLVTIILVPNVYYIVEKKRKVSHRAIY